MKKYKDLIISIIILVLSFFNSWYSLELLDLLFAFRFIPSLILFVLYVRCLNINIRKLTKKFCFTDLITNIILVVTAVLILFFPFIDVKVNIELKLYEEERLNVIDMISTKKLIPDEVGNVVLPNYLKKISTSGEVFVYQNDKDNQVIGFWIFRGIVSGSSQIIYSTGGEQLIKDNETGHPIVLIKHLKDNWYYVEEEY